MQDWHIRGVRTYGSKDSGRKATPSAEDGGDTDKQLHGRSNNSDNVRSKEPASSVLVGVHAIGELFGEKVVDMIIQTPHLDRVEPVLGLALRTLLDNVVAIVVFSPAVVPQPNGVKVLELPSTVSLPESRRDILKRRIR